MKRYIFFFILFITQSCYYYPVRKDYGIYSKSLVFSKDKKWLINNIKTGVESHHREMMEKEVMQLFQELSNGNAFDRKQQNLIQSSIPFEPQTEDLETLKSSSDFNFLVNIYTMRVRNSLDRSIGELDDKKNETFAMMDIYDIKP
jgi:hypothetical protein